MCFCYHYFYGESKPKDSPIICMKEKCKRWRESKEKLEVEYDDGEEGGEAAG